MCFPAFCILDTLRLACHGMPTCDTRAKHHPSIRNLKFNRCYRNHKHRLSPAWSQPALARPAHSDPRLGTAGTSSASSASHHPLAGCSDPLLGAAAGSLGPPPRAALLQQCMMSMAEVTTYKHQLKDGRQLSYAVLGLPINSHDKPRATCIYTHGWPSSRLEAIPLHNAALNLQYRILSLDRPGIGGSMFDPAGSFESWARDVQQLLDAQGVQRAVFIGMSGGGPFACACARFLPERTAALVTMSSMVATNDPEAAGLKAQMHWMNRFHSGVIGNALALRASVLATWPLMMIAPFAASALRSVLPASVARLLLQLATAAGYSDADRRLLVDNPDATLQLLWVMQQAVVQGVAGLEHDMALTSDTWSFRLEDIRAPVVLVFQGEGDVNVPKAMGEHLVAAIPGAQAIMLPGEGHMSPLMNHPAAIMTRLDEALHGKQ